MSTVTLGNDTFTEGPSTDVLLSNHTPDSGFSAWETNVTETGSPSFTGAHVNISTANETDKLQLNFNDTGLGYRCTGDIGDGDLHLFVDCQCRSVFGSSFPAGRFLVNASQTGSFYQKGAGMAIDRGASSTVNILAERFHDGAQQESSAITSGVSMILGGKRRFGFRKVDQTYSYYYSDYGTGLNEIAAGSYTMGTGSTTGLSELTDGTHKGVQLFTEGTQSPETNNWEWDNLTVDSDSGVTVPSASTLSSVALDTSRVSSEWSSVTSATGYKLQRQGIFDVTLNTIFSSASTSYLDTGLTSFSSYTYAVVSYNSQGDGPRSNLVALRTQEVFSPPPDLPDDPWTPPSTPQPPPGAPGEPLGPAPTPTDPTLDPTTNPVPTPGVTGVAAAAASGPWARAYPQSVPSDGGVDYELQAREEFAFSVSSDRPHAIVSSISEGRP